MNLIQSFALQAGQQITKPFICEKFYPLPDCEYTTFQPFSRPSKNYDYYNEVLNIIHPILEKANIKIIQVGAKDEPGFPCCIQTQGSTSLGQLAYLIKNAKLHFGADSIGQHYAGHFNVKLVDLVSNNYKSAVAPFWGNRDNQIILEPDREKLKPSFALDEPYPKQINSIYPETIAAAVCKLLNLPFDYPYRTLRFGAHYNNKLVESIPDQVIHINNLGIQTLFYRMDVIFNEENLFKQLQICKCLVFTNRPINKDLIIKMKPQILEIHYEINEEYSVDFVDFLREIGVKFYMFSYLGEDELNKAKLNLFDYGIIYKKSVSEFKDIKGLEGADLSKIHYRSHKFTLSQEKIYPSIGAYLENQHIPNFENVTRRVIDTPAFWREIEHFYLLTRV